MNYNQTLDYLYEQLPMFHRIGAAAYKANLDNTNAICDLLHHPENKFRSIHVAGTNGKGSTSHMLAAVLQTSGYKTGLYTSPHLRDFRERVRINGSMISEEEVVLFVDRYRNEFDAIHPSFFEWTVGLAFDFFARENVDVAVIETGLGGRLDSTNVILPLLSVITNIGWDHMSLLGDTLEKIANEKAGIIKANIPLIVGEDQSGTSWVFREKAREVQAPVVFASSSLRAARKSGINNIFQIFDIFQGETILFEDLEIGLAGHYQEKNILTVIQSILELRKQGFNISDQHIRIGLKDVCSLTGFLGRWQVLSTNPLTICDVAHNIDGLALVMKQICEIPHREIHMVFGAVNDKDISGILKILLPDAKYYFCKAAIPRGMDANELLKEAREKGLQGEAFGSVSMAMQAAQGNAGEKDIVFVGGSTFIVAEVL